MVVDVSHELSFDFCVELARQMLVHHILYVQCDQVSYLIIFYLARSEVLQECLFNLLIHGFLNTFERECIKHELFVEDLIIVFELDFGLFFLVEGAVDVGFI